MNKELLEEAKKTVTLIFNDGVTKSEEIEIPESITYKNPYNYDLLQFLPNVTLFDLNTFFSLTKTVLQNENNLNKLPIINITEEYPPDNMEDYGQEVLSYKVISRQPGAVDQNNSIRPKRYRPSYTIKDHHTGDLIEIHKRSLDHEIEITCWATTNKMANARALWLERLLVTESWVYKSRGADRFYFLKRLSDGYMTTGQQKLFYRPLRFFLRYDEFISLNRNEIKNINIITSITSEIE